MRTVHPHGRGEHGYSKVRKLADYGSSPRAWGTHRKCGDRHQISPVHPPRAWGTREHGPGIAYTWRFIPTGVGNTAPRNSAGFSQAVHPHGRGEHVRKPPPNDPAFGSSPRAWGTHTVLVASSAGNRFIPTGVGNTAKGYVLPAQRAVHPHGRGEHSTNSRASCTHTGSSPRAWGTPIRIEHGNGFGRFIPTGVGNTDHARIG